MAPAAAPDRLPDPESLLAALRGVQSEALRTRQRRTDSVIRKLRTGQEVDPLLEHEDGVVGELARAANGLAEVREGMRHEFSQAVALERQSDAAQLVRAIHEQLRAQQGAAGPDAGPEAAEAVSDEDARAALDGALERVVMGDDGGASAAMRAVRAGEGAVQAALRCAAEAAAEQDALRQQIREELATKQGVDLASGREAADGGAPSAALSGSGVADEREVEFILLQRRHNLRCYGDAEGSDGGHDEALPPGFVRFQEALLARRLEMVQAQSIARTGLSTRDKLLVNAAVADASQQTFLQLEAAPLSVEQRQELTGLTEAANEAAKQGRQAALQELQAAWGDEPLDAEQLGLTDVDDVMRLVPARDDSERAASEVFGPLLQQLEAMQAGGRVD